MKIIYKETKQLAQAHTVNLPQNQSLNPSTKISQINVLFYDQYSLQFNENLFRRQY